MTIDITVSSKFSRFMQVLHGDGRRMLYSSAAVAVADLVRRYLISLSQSRHATARRLGARPSGHIEKAAQKTVHSASADHGEVTIPAPGFTRAFGDVEIKPLNAKRLTIPINRVSYNRRVGELRALGWKFFTRPKKDVLFGYRGQGKDKETMPLYLLRTRVIQTQDRSLLPADETIAQTSCMAIAKTLQTIARKAGL